MSTARAVVVTRVGDLSVLEVQDRAIRPPRPGHVQVEVIAAGVNYIDVYKREGIYPMPTPYVQGQEGSGRVVAVGPGVTRFEEGDIVAWFGEQDSQATLVNRDVNELVLVPDGVDPVVAAAAMLQGLTAHYLSVSTHPIQPGEIALVHAAAGGVGQLLVQMITHRGGEVIATAGSDEKLDLARDLGAMAGINYTTTEDLAAVVYEVAGRGVDVVYDGVGRATFDASLASLRPRGTMVLFGAASGQVPPFELQRLNSEGSLYITRPNIVHYISDRKEYEWRAGQLFEWIQDGTIHIDIGGRFDLEHVADAYEALESRSSVGKLVVLP